MTNRTSIIPDSKGEVQAKLLKFKSGGPTVEEARAAMMTGREAATTTGGGTKVPSFIKKEAERGQGGNVPSGRPEDSRAALLASAHEKISSLRVPQGKRINLDAMRDAGMINQAEVDALLAESNGTAVPAAVAATPVEVFEDEEAPAATEETTTPAPATQALETQAPARVAAEDNQARRIETAAFVGQVFREGKDWVAEITYKNGAGTERFVAGSKDDLMLKVLEGKGHGTVKVREVVRENKRRLLYGDENDTWDFFYAEVEKSHGLTVEQYLALPKVSRDLIQDTIQAQQILAFQQNWPEYYGTTKNFEKICKYLNNKKPESWPLTYRNLELAYKDLTADEELDLRPAAKVDVAPVATPSVTTTQATPTVEDSTSAAAAPAAPVVAQPRKRGISGLVPGSSSASSTEAATRAEDGTQQRVLSERDYRTMPIADLKRIVVKDRKFGGRS